MKVVVVLPTYNEAGNIKGFIETLLKEFAYIEQNMSFDMNILVVDDYSPDKTADIVLELAKTNTKINLLMNNNRGLGKAYIAGFKYVLKNLSADIVMQMDSDFSHEPEKIRELLLKISEGADFVIGSRYVTGGTLPENWSLFRKLNSKFGNIFARHIAGIYPVNDCTSGFRAIKIDVIKNIDLNTIKAEGYCFLIELLLKTYKQNYKIVETPINFLERKAGKSKLSFKNILEFILYSCSVRFLKH